MPVGSLRPEEVVMGPDDLSPENEGVTKETYTMEFMCSNCGTSFEHDVPIGKPARFRGGACPYCNVMDCETDGFSYKKPGIHLTEKDY